MGRGSPEAWIARMRTGRREHKALDRAGARLAAALVAVLVAATGLSAPRARARELPAPPGIDTACRWTVEVDWSAPASAGTPAAPAPAASGATLALSAGRILDAVPVSPDAARPSAVPGGGTWSLGPANKGRVRARIEAPPAAQVVVRVAGQESRVALAALLEGPQRPTLGGGVEIGVERPAWDSIRVELGPEAADGTATAGAGVPLRVGFDIRTPELGEVAVRASAELRPIRGGDPVWRHDWQEVVAAYAPADAGNDAAGRASAMTLTAPPAEGTYVLEVRASWEPLSGNADTRLGRLVRRRRAARDAANTASRRVTLAVLASPNRAATPPLPSRVDGAGIEVDSVDLGRTWGHRLTASGRSPLLGPGLGGWAVPDAAVVEPAVRDRLRGWINRKGAEVATLAPADPAGLAWTAVPLRVPHPERPHRLAVSVVGGQPAALGVAMIAAPGGVGGNARVVLDACASGPPVAEGDAPATLSWPVWPDDPSPTLVLVNRDGRSPVVVGSVTLEEMPEPAPAPGLARNPARSLGLHLGSARDLDRFGGSAGNETGRVDPMVRARNLAAYLGSCGATGVVLPDGLPDRARRRALDGQADEDSIGPDRLSLLLRVLARRGVSAWVDVAFDDALPGLPAPDSAEAVAEGLARLDRRGRPDGSYQPLHPRVREAMARRVADAVAARKVNPNMVGALVRLGPGSTLPGGPDSGLDDATFRRFARAAFDNENAVGLLGRGGGTDDPGRFEARAQFVESKGRPPWLAWRSAEVAALYRALADAARAAAPGSALAVATPGLDPGPAGDEARRVDQAGLGPDLAWKNLGFDLAAWPRDEKAPIVLRSAGLSAGDLAHDLATSAELDDPVAARPDRGALLGVGSAAPGRPAGPCLLATPTPDGPAGDEAMGHAVAALDATRVIIAATAATGQEQRLRRFSRPFSAMPTAPIGGERARSASGAVARTFRQGNDTILALANDTPYPILMETELAATTTAPVDDLGRGLALVADRGAHGSRVVIDLPPFGIAAARVAAPEARIALARPHLDPAALEGMKARYEELAARLGRLQSEPAAGARAPGPAGGGFEPETVQLATNRSTPVVPGWNVAPATAATGGGGSIEIDRDRPHAGRGSLRLDAVGSGVAATSDPFRPAGRTALTVRAWVRGDRPDGRARIRLEGQAAGRPVAAQVEVATRAEWTEATLNLGSIPPGGLDSARLRFELAGPGRLWVDDVTVTGDAPTESERLYASRDLRAALLAYRDGRLADFARKAGSHWTRFLVDVPAVAADPRPPIRTGNASALPPNRSLR